MDLKLLEYPRALHGPGMAHMRVETADEAEAAIRNGWSVDIVPDDAPEPVTGSDESPIKRGPGRPKKLL